MTTQTSIRGAAGVATFFTAVGWVFIWASATLAQQLGSVPAPLDEDRPGCWQTAFSADGNRVLAISQNGWTVWDRRQQKEVQTVTMTIPRQWQLDCGTMSADGKTVAVADGETVFAYDVDSGELRWEFRQAERANHGVALSPDGRLLAIGESDDEDARVSVFDIENREKLCTFEACSERLSSIVFMPDGQRLLTAGGEDDQDPMSLKVWDVRAGTMVASSRFQKSPLTALEVSADGSTIVASSYDESLRVFKLEADRLKVGATVSLADAQSYDDISLSADGSIMCLKNNREVEIWDLTAPSQLLHFWRERLVDVALSFDGTVLATAVEGESSVILWDLKAMQRTGKAERMWRMNDEYAYRVRELQLYDNGSRLAVTAAGAPITLYDMGTLRPLSELQESQGKPLKGDFNSRVAVHPSGSELLSGYSGGDFITRLRLDTNRSERFLSKGDGQYFEAIFYSPDGSIKAIGMQTQMLLLDADDAPIFKKAGQFIRDKCGAISSDNHWLATSSDRDELWLFDIEQKLEVGKFGVGGRFSFCRDNRRLVGSNGILWRLDVESGEIDYPFLLHAPNGTGDVGEIGVAATVPLMAAASNHDLCVRLWNYETGQLVLTLPGHKKDITAISVSPDGKTVVSGDEDGVVAVWKVPEDILADLAQPREQASSAAAQPETPANAWPMSPTTLRTSQGISVTIIPTSPVTREDVQAALREAAEQVAK